MLWKSKERQTERKRRDRKKMCLSALVWKREKNKNLRNEHLYGFEWVVVVVRVACLLVSLCVWS